MTNHLAFDPTRSTLVSSDSGESVYAYGVTVKDMKVTDFLDFSKIGKDVAFDANLIWRETARLDLLEEGTLVYLQKGQNERMTHPYIVSSVEYNPNNNTNWSIAIRFEPTYSRSQWVELYMQLPENPETLNDAVNVWNFSEYTAAKDGTLSTTADNGGFIPVPDELVVEAFPDEFKTESVVTHFI